MIELKSTPDQRVDHGLLCHHSLLVLESAHMHGNDIGICMAAWHCLDSSSWSPACEGQADAPAVLRRLAHERLGFGPTE